MQAASPDLVAPQAPETCPKPADGCDRSTLHHDSFSTTRSVSSHAKLLCSFTFHDQEAHNAFFSFSGQRRVAARLTAKPAAPRRRHRRGLGHGSSPAQTTSYVQLDTRIMSICHSSTKPSVTCFLRSRIVVCCTTKPEGRQKI